MNRSSTPRFKAAGAPLMISLTLLPLAAARGATLSLPLLGGNSMEAPMNPEGLSDALDLNFSGPKMSAAAPVSRPAATPAPAAERERPAPAKPRPKVTPRPKPKAEEDEPPVRRKPRRAETENRRPKAGEPREERSGPEPEIEVRPAKPADSPAEPASGKEPVGKDTVPALTAPVTSPVSLLMSTGWYNKVYFRGLDVLDRVSPDDANSGASSTVIKVVKGNWEGGVQYIQALDQQLPDGALLDQDPNAVDARGRRVSRNEDFRIPSKERYSEADFWLKYTHPLIPDKWDLSAGISHYRFSDERFWGISDATELQLATSWNGFQYVVPSVTYAWDFNGFEGSYAEFGLYGKNLPTYRNGNFGIGFQPYAKVSYDFEYNGDNTGWNSFETGVVIPIQLPGKLVLNLTGNYSVDLGDGISSGARRTDDGFWAGISLGTATTFNRFNAAQAQRYGKDVLPPAVPAPTKWALSAGAGTRSISADFEDRPVFLTPALNLVSRLVDKGTLDSGKAGLRYGDGSIGADEPGFGADPSGLAGYSGGTVSGSYEDGDQQILFTSDRYSYSNRAEGFSFRSEDEDRVIYPYINLSYDLGAPGGLSAAIRYSFTRAEFDSGIHLSSLDRADENYTRYLFLYDGNNLANDGTLIYNSSFLQGQLGDRPVQKGTQGLRTEKTKIATFVQSSLDVDLHSLTIPLEWTMDIGERAHLSLSAGPSINLFNAELSTTAWSRELDNLGGGRVLFNSTNFRKRRGIFSGDFVEVDTTGNPGQNPVLVNGSASNDNNSGSLTSGSSDAGAKSPSAPGAARGSAAASARRSGVKGGTARAPQLPGRDVGSRSWTETENRFEWGVSAQTTFRWDLDQADRWFIELWGRYDYVNPFTISTAVSSVEIDASSWGVGAGIGFRF